MTSADVVDYGAIYNGYWDKPDRVGECSGNLSSLAETIAETCGKCTAIDVGCGEGFLVSEMLARGIDAVGMDVSGVVVKRANTHCPGRFFQGSVLSMPFPDGGFDMVVSTGCMEHLAPSDIPVALREIYRVSSRYVFLQIATTQDRDGHWLLTINDRAWWEARCFEAGFRKHALYYRANPYEALNRDDWQILILLEKVPADALREYDLSNLEEERLLHMDMLRETGRRSDAHCIRYHKAAEYIRSGDTVLDVASGLGYGSHILYSNSQAGSVLGVDLSEFGIAYASYHYRLTDAIEFRTGNAQFLSFIPDHSIDFITAFETIEHVPDPIAYLGELKRVLKPAGRVMVCAPNNWTDETGKDPNPHHLHVYTWERLVAECDEHFLLEKGFLQIAGGAMKCHHSPRSWIEVPVDIAPQQNAEWILLLCMSDPVACKTVPYMETAWNIPTTTEFHVSAFSRDYENPWLVKGMVAIGMRIRSGRLLDTMQHGVLASMAKDSVDYGAALCGQAYVLLQRPYVPADTHEWQLKEIRSYAAIPKPSPHQLRWQVSLLFAGGELLRKRGLLDQAQELFSMCAARDVLPYSPLLGNKVLDALHWLAVMALSRHDVVTARSCLLKCVSEAERLSTSSWLNVRGKKDAPLPFGLAEMAQLLDKASRAAYMLSVLDSSSVRGGVLHQESLGFFERQIAMKNHRIAELEKSIGSLSTELTERERICQSLAGEVARHDAHAQELAHEVRKQDAHAQELAHEVRKQDAHAQELARIINKQDAILMLLRPWRWPGAIKKRIQKINHE